MEIDTLVAVSGKVDTKRGEANLLVNSIDRELRVVEIADEQVTLQSLSQHIQPQDSHQDSDTMVNVQTTVATQETNELQLPDTELLSETDQDELIVKEYPSTEILPEPQAAIGDQSSESPRRIVVTLRPEDNQSDYQLRVKWAFNVLNSFPGEDRFVMVVYESDDRCYELDFSNHTTGYCEELRKQLMQVVNSQDDIEVQSLLL